MTRTLLFQNNVPKFFLSETILTAVYLINRLPSTNLFFKSPYEIFYGRKLNLEHLKLFDCVCFIHKNRLDKLDFTSIKTIFLEYSSKKRGTNVTIQKIKKIYILRDVFFLENEPIYKAIKEKYCDQYSSNDFMLPCGTNLGGRKIFVENHIHIGNQGSGNNTPSQGKG
jgi:hypothetical protein